MLRLRQLIDSNVFPKWLPRSEEIVYVRGAGPRSSEHRTQIPSSGPASRATKAQRRERQA